MSVRRSVRSRNYFLFANVSFFFHIQLSSVRISRDNKGVKPGWLVDKITIDVDEKDEHYVFYCNRWLGSSDAAIEFTPGNSSSCIEHAK